MTFDPYNRNRFTGGFIIIDEATNQTLGAGMILEPKRTIPAAEDDAEFII
jgi:bifunctional enzyme CysN/CysC